MAEEDEVKTPEGETPTPETPAENPTPEGEGAPEGSEPAE